MPPPTRRSPRRPPPKSPDPKGRQPTRDSPRRTCVGCRRVAPNHELLRVHCSNGELLVGPGAGRGAWLCAEHPIECLELTVKRSGLARALRTEVSGGALERLRARLGG
ncbi:MAG: YlxR family protein [Acidimicrobiia bacterium]